MHCKGYITRKIVILKTFKCFLSTKQPNMLSITPSLEVRGMKTLDRDRFQKSVDIPTLKINETDISQTMRFIKKYLLKLDNFKPVREIDSNHGTPAVKYACLNPCLVKSWMDIQAIDRDHLISLGINDQFFQLKRINFDYENWKADEILKLVLPADKDSLTSFSSIGHIVHVNLRDHLLEYKELIGQVLLDKVKTCKTVVNKTNTIDNTYRNFKMEVLCGETNFLVKVKENKCYFEFDFSKVYWNPRLCSEHERIVMMLKKGDILFDVFAGVGPFSIPAAKNKCTVYANDLNPESYKWLIHNAKINKVTENYFKSYNMDGNDFIKKVFSKYLIDTFVNSEGLLQNQNIHITMNLPALAVEFLNSFEGILSTSNLENLIKFKEPMVHVYCFVMADNPYDCAQKLVEKNLNCELGNDLIEIFNVRNVSPTKEMMRVSFKLRQNVLLKSNKRKRSESDVESANKS